MNKIKYLLAVALASLVTVSAQAGVKEIGVVNGVHLVRVKNLGLFAPSQVTLLAYTPGKEGIEVLAHTGGPGVVPAVATAGGVVGGAALLRPARTSVKNAGGNATGGSSSSTSTSGATAAGGNANATATGGAGGGHVHNNGNTNGNSNH
jgi:hypothetical protein